MNEKENKPILLSSRRTILQITSVIGFASTGSVAPVTAQSAESTNVEFDGQNDNGELEVTQESGVDVTGSTTADPDSDAVLRLRSSDSNTLIREADLTISESGEFESTVDFSEFNSGEELTLQFVVDSETINSITAIVTTEATVTFDDLNEDGELEVPRDNGVVITGTTTADPSADTMLRFVSTDAADEFRMAEEVSVNQDGEFIAPTDFSDKEVGDEFETRFRVDDVEVRVVDSVVVRAEIQVSYDQDRAGANRPTEIEVYPNAEFEISGRAYNTYPDDEAVLRFASTDADNDFRIQKSVDLSTDGEFSTTVDFSDLEAGDEFTTYFRVNGERVDESDSFVVEPPESESDTETQEETEQQEEEPDETNGEESTTEETGSDTDTEDEQDTETQEETEQQEEEPDETNGEESTTEETDSDTDTEDEPSTQEAVDVVLDELGDIVAEWLS